MRILLDECVPRALRRHLTGHNVLTSPQLGWAGKKNGELMRLIDRNGFEVFITVDKSLQFQQHLSSLTFAIIRLSSQSNRLADLAPLMPQVMSALATIKSGDVLEIHS
jgi:hypothetical protein